MADTPVPAAAAQSQRAAENFRKNVARVIKATQDGMYAPALEAACRIVVAEAKRTDRALAWNDVTGNLRASISFQVEGRRKAPLIFSRAAAGPDAGAIYNLTDYKSGENRMDGEYGVVYAPPEYAIHVELKSTRSVLLEPVVTVHDALFHGMANEAKKQWLELAFDMRVFGAG